MRNLFLSLFVTVFFCCIGNSQEKFENDYKVEFKRASLITTFENERFEYIFSSLFELDENWEQFILDVNFKNVKIYFIYRIKSQHIHSFVSELAIINFLTF